MSHIFLYGPSGTGKSTLGALLARNLRLPFIDLDQVIETNAGMSIPQIMDGQGESAFRDMETAALRNLMNHSESVVALGGGALVRDENRAFANSHGKIILLTGELTTLLARLKGETNNRPLLAGDLETKLSSILEKRREHYASFPLKVQVDGKTPEQIANHIQIMVGRHHLSAMGEYDVIVGQIANWSCTNPVIVTDENVAKFHLEKIKQAVGNDVRSVIIPA